MDSFKSDAELASQGILPISISADAMNTGGCPNFFSSFTWIGFSDFISVMETYVSFTHSSTPFLFIFFLGCIWLMDSLRNLSRERNMIWKQKNKDRFYTSSCPFLPKIPHNPLSKYSLCYCIKTYHSGSIESYLKVKQYLRFPLQSFLLHVSALMPPCASFSSFCPSF